MTELSAFHGDDDDQSEFEKRKRNDERGEWWSARDLQAPLGYSNWQRFEDAIERAKLACANSGESINLNFTASDKNAGRVGRTGVDYRLTRFGAYLVAMNGDPRKSEIAEAQRYFAVKTREAELSQGRPELRNPVLQRIVDMTYAIQANEDAQRRLEAEQVEQRRELTDHAERLSAVEQVLPLTGSDLMTLRDAAHACGTGQNRFKAWLFETGVMFTDHDGHDRLKQYPWVENGWAVERWERWANRQGHSWVPRFTARGVVELRRRFGAT